MSFLTSEASSCGTIIANPEFDAITVSIPKTSRVAPSVSMPNPLARLAELLLANDRLMEELASSRGRIARARAYQDEPGCNVRFGLANFERCRVKHSGILAQLRANRIEAMGLLGRSATAI